MADDLDWWFLRIDHFLDRGGILLGYVNNNVASHSPAVVQRLQQRLGED